LGQTQKENHQNRTHITHAAIIIIILIYYSSDIRVSGDGSGDVLLMMMMVDHEINAQSQNVTGLSLGGESTPSSDRLSYASNVFTTPPHWHKNMHVKRGYEVYLTYKECFRTLYTWNTETGSVYTTLVALFAIVLLYVNISMLPATSVYTKLTSGLNGLKIGLLLFMAHLALVAGYHIFLHLPRHYRYWSVVDLVSINSGVLGMGYTLLTSGYRFEFPPCISSMFVPHVSNNAFLTFQFQFSVLLFVCVNASAFVATIRLTMRTNESPLVLIVANIVPGAIVIVCYACHRIHAPESRAMLVVILFTVGALLFVSKVPERLSTRTFDLFGYSHMLWHVCYMTGFYLFFTDLFVAQTGQRELLWLYS